MEVNIQANGKGRAKLEAYNEETKKRVSLEVSTEDYGRNWSVIQGTANHNSGYGHELAEFDPRVREHHDRLE